MNRRQALSLSMLLLARPLLAGPKIFGKTEAELSGLLRGLLLDHLPQPLHEKSIDWGRTKEVKVLKTYRGKIFTERQPKNDGRWRKLRVEALMPRDTLVLDLRELDNSVAGQLTCRMHISADVRYDGTQEQWESGIKLYSTSVRARARIHATLACLATIKTELVNLLPEIVVTFKVTKAETAYDHLVVEHVAGLGGEAAKAIGNVGHELIHQWKPSIERSLLEKANHAIEKALAKKEVRLSLAKLFKK